MSDPEQLSPPDEEFNIEQALIEAETSLNALKERHHSIQTAQTQQQHLQEKILELHNQAEQLQQEPEQQLKLQQEIEQLLEQLHDVELGIECQLFEKFTLAERLEMFRTLTLPEKGEWFWHFLKYMGLGFGAALLWGYLTR